MSGIAGILCFNGAPVEPGQIEKLTASMAALGPDEQTCWIQGSMALGHCMLRTTAESIGEHQPLISQDKQQALVWDGRLDNRAELQRDLVYAGAILREHSDAGLALESYAIWGEECPERLSGDFAFAVWDARHQRLFCARDHMGARPFYYTRNERFFAFASEEEALLSLPGVSHQPNEEKIANVLVPAFRSDDCESSWLESVRNLPPARWMHISPDGAVQSENYWKLEPGEESVYASDTECEEAFLEVFGAAVRCRMRSTGSISAMMSGGLDSAAIAAMVKRLLPEMHGQEFHTYSTVSDQPETCVESQCIRSLTQDLGDRAHFVAVPSMTGMLDVQDLIKAGWSRAHPVDNSILLPAMMCLAASRDGHRVMLHGMGGDYALHAPDRYIAYLLRAGQWRQATRECAAASRNHTYLRGETPFMLLLRNAWTAYAPAASKGWLRSLRNLRTKSPLVQSILNPDCAEKLRLADRVRTTNRTAPLDVPTVQQAHIAAMQPPYGYVLGLNGYNRVAGRYGIELRDPWSDRRVAEFCLRLPLEYKIRHGWTKYLLRTAFESGLQPLVRWRSGKEHLGWYFARRLMDESSTLVASTLGAESGILDPYLDRKALCGLCVSGSVAGHDCDWEQTYNAVTLGLWLKRISC